MVLASLNFPRTPKTTIVEKTTGVKLKTQDNNKKREKKRGKPRSFRYPKHDTLIKVILSSKKGDKTQEHKKISFFSPRKSLLWRDVFKLFFFIFLISVSIRPWCICRRTPIQQEMVLMFNQKD